MYCFPESLKRAYESSPLSFVYYQNVEGRAVPVLASDGFVRNTGMSREKVLVWLKAGLFERMHPDDVGFMAKVSDDFLNHRAPYDALFRCRIGKEYALIHGIGKWQVMPDGTELAVIGYANVSRTKEGQLSEMEKFGLAQKDRFYYDSVTGLPGVTYMK